MSAGTQIFAAGEDERKVILRSLAGRGCRFIVLAFALSLVLVPQHARGAEKVLMSVIVNSEQRGDFTFLLVQDNAVLFPRRALVDLGLVHLPDTKSRVIGGEEYVNLRDLDPALSYEIDMKSVTLTITAAPSMFTRQIKHYQHERPPGLQVLTDPSAYVNYSLGYSVDSGRQSFSLPWEAAINTGKGLLYSSFMINRDNGQDRSVRLNTNYTVDDMGHLRRFVFGDFAAASGGLGGGGSFAGFSMSKYYGLNPYLVRNAGLTIQGTAATPSAVRVYLDGQLVRSDSVAPGAFELQGIANLGGLQNYSLVIRDAYGRETTINNSVYLTPTLLKAGFDEYSFNFGLSRERLGQESNQYRDPTLITFYRKGITSYFTTGVNFEANSNVMNLGVENEFPLQRAGDMKVSLAASQSEQRTGNASIVAYQYLRRAFNVLVMMEQGTHDYATVSMPVGMNTLKRVLQLSFGFNIATLGGISLSAADSKHYMITDNRRYSLSYSARISKNISLFVTGSRTTTNDTTFVAHTQYDIFANIMMLLGSTSSGGVNISRTDSGNSEGAFLFQNPPLGEGVGYQINVDSARRGAAGDRQTSGVGMLNYNGPYGKYEIGYRRDGQSEQYSLQAAGAVAYVDKGVYWGRPIFDGFAVVKVSDIEGVRVMEDNQEIGRTNGDGKVMVPQLISYYENRLTIDDHDIPVNYEIDNLDKDVSPQYRGGGLVEFSAKKLQGITGHLNIQDDKQHQVKSAEYWGLGLKVADKTIDVVIGKGGEFYLENIPSGTYKTRAFEKEKSCYFDMVIPKSKEMMLDLGEITCVVAH